MLRFEKYSLNNGLRVVLHVDKSTPIVAVNTIYDVGSRDETIRRTGIAHLLEHLMFSGSKNAPKFDIHIDQAGGENNAFTNSDLTNYYITIPKNNIETALWLESDRMENLSLTDKSLEIQRKVVIEEFKQNYLNQPYGDAYIRLKSLAYKKHPYRWTTIGRNVKQIENVSNRYIKNFYKRFYSPSNAIITIAGDIDIDQIKKSIEHWFGYIKGNGKPTKQYSNELTQTKKRVSRVVADVPQNSIYMAWHMGNRMSDEYYVCDIISDILSSGQSSRLYRLFVKDMKLFSEVNAFITGDIDNGLFIINGKLNQGKTSKEAIKIVEEEINRLKTDLVQDNELQKIINKIESNFVFSQSSVLSKAMSLGYYELLGDADIINYEIDNYRKVNASKIQLTAKKLFKPQNTNILIYTSSKQ